MLLELSLNEGTVLLRQAVKPFTQMGFDWGEIYATPEEVTLTPFDPTSLTPTVTLALWMKSSMFETCINHQNVWLAFDVHSFYHNNLCQVRDDDDFVGLYVDDENDDFGGFELSNCRTRRFIEGEIPLISVHLRELAAPTPQFQHEYNVIVGIRSNEFRRLITYLGHIGVLVAARVTDTEVKFSVGDIEVVYSKELRQCIIGGDVGEEIQFSCCSISSTLAQLRLLQSCPRWCGCWASPMVYMSCCFALLLDLLTSCFALVLLKPEA